MFKNVHNYENYLRPGQGNYNDDVETTMKNMLKSNTFNRS